MKAIIQNLKIQAYSVERRMYSKNLSAKRYPLNAKILLLITSCCLLVTAMGCETLAHKFTRKPKSENLKTEDVVFAPQEYKLEKESNQDLYSRYFLYWKTWQDELIDSLEKSGNRKRQIDSLNEAIKNLENIKLLLKPESADRLGFYTNQLHLLRTAITKDIYANSVANNRCAADRIKRDILRNFSFNKIKDSII